MKISELRKRLDEVEIYMGDAEVLLARDFAPGVDFTVWMCSHTTTPSSQHTAMCPVYIVAKEENDGTRT